MTLPFPFLSLPHPYSITVYTYGNLLSLTSWDKRQTFPSSGNMRLYYLLYQRENVYSLILTCLLQVTPDVLHVWLPVSGVYHFGDYMFGSNYTALLFPPMCGGMCRQCPLYINL